MSRLESLIAANILTGSLPQTTGEVSAKFLKGARKALDIYRSWGLPRNVDLSSFTPVELKTNGEKVGLFFTLGVDSFYSLLTHVNEIDDIIYVAGFERRLKEKVLNDVMDKIELVARKYDKGCYLIDSNLRDTVDKYADWYRYGHGPSLASVALSMDHTYKKIYIAASNTLKVIQKCSSHPYIDPLWSTETLTFVHDAPITRIEKLKKISESQFALDLLRVCYQGHSYNCSKCPKCVRTMLSIHLLGLNSTSFGKRPSLSAINKLSHQEMNTTGWPLWDQNIKELEKLLKALKGQL
jgi:hypothetical protein